MIQLKRTERLFSQTASSFSLSRSYSMHASCGLILCDSLYLLDMSSGAYTKRRDAYKKVRSKGPDLWSLNLCGTWIGNPVDTCCPSANTRYGSQAIDNETCRRRREDASVEIRKQKREENLAKRRFMSDDLPQDGSSLPGTDQQSLTNKAARVDDLPRYGFI